MALLLAFLMAVSSHGVVCHDKALTRPPRIVVELRDRHFEDGSVRPVGIHLYSHECGE